jgi:hypothetical protein
VSLKQGLITLMVKVQVDALFLASLAVYVTVVKPTLKHEPDECEAESVGVLQLSVAVGAVQETIEQESPVVFTKLAGQLAKAGLIESRKHGLLMVTVKAQVDVLLRVSFAV